jgi:ABC-2 type transport system ATP-binding protein
VRPTDGEIAICGNRAGSRQARAAIGYLAELFRFPAWASGDEVLRFHQRLVRSEAGAAERAELLELVGLSDAAAVRVEAMSKGMQQRLGIAQALVGSPHLLLLDEPTSALDPVGRRIVRELLAELRSRGVAVLLNSHLLGEVERVCKRVAILRGGTVVVTGRTDELLRPRGVEVETQSGTRLYDGVGRDDVPRIVAELAAAGERIYSVRALASTLEEVYLEAVEGETR